MYRNSNRQQFKSWIKKLFKFFQTFKKVPKKRSSNNYKEFVHPGICEKVYEIIKDKNKNLSYCPERIVQGKSIKELPNISQLVSGKNNKSIQESANLFKKFVKKLFELR